MYVQTILAFMAEKQKAQKSYKGEWEGGKHYLCAV